MPDDEHLGGTRDPHEYGRRHRREEPAPGEEKPRRRRRSMEASGGLSVADLVQKHSASRSDLTSVDPQQLQQNTLMSGRRARQDRQSAEGPAGRGHPGEAPRRPAPHPTIADALNGADAPEFPRDDAPPRSGRRAARGGFPPDEPPRRNGFPPDKGPRRAGEASAHHAAPEPPPPFPGPGETSGPRSRRGDGSAHHAIPGKPPAFPPDVPRPGQASAHHAVPAAPAFPPDVPRPGPSPRPRRAGEAPAHHAMPEPRAFAPEAPRRAGEASAHHAVPEPPAFPGPGETSGPRSRRGDGSAHHAVPGEPPAFPRDEMPRGARRPGEGSARHPVPGDGPRNGFPPDNARRVGEASTHHPVPGDPRNGFPRDDARHPGPVGPGGWPAEQLSEPRLTPAAIDAPDTPPRPKTTGVPPVPMMPPRRDEDDPISMTTEMEAIGAIGEDVQKRRTIDHTLARFSAVHDEIKAEEREKKAKRRKLRPWQKTDEDEMDRLDELDAQQSMAMHIPPIPAEPEPEPEAEDEDAQPARPRKKKLRNKLRGRSAGKAFVVIVAALVFVSTAAAWGFKAYVEAGSRDVDALDPDSAAIQDAGAQLGDENFLLVGSDTRAGAGAEDGVGDESTIQGARSDTVMIAHVPKNRQRAVVVSFPRDLEVTRPACEGWDAKTGEYNGKQHPAEEQVKLNSAYQVGGPKCVTKMVQELSGLAINHFVGIDFNGFKEMVDAVAGVEVCVERPMKDETLGVIVPEAGKSVRLTGDQALNFVRARSVEGDVTADYGRIIRQQRFLSSLLRKAMSSEVLLDPGKLTGFVDAFSKATFGENIGVDQLFTLGQSMQGVEAGRVTFITVPTVGYQNDRRNEDLRVEDNNALFEAIRQDTPLPGEAAPKKPADDASQSSAQQSGLKQDQPQGPVDPKTIKIQVLNGGNETGGIAGDTADALAEFGFQIMRVDSSPEGIDKIAVIKYSKGREAQAQTLQAAVPGSVLQEDPSMAGAIMLIVGPGFDGEVVSPTAGGKVAEVPENLSTVNAGDVSCA